MGVWTKLPAVEGSCACLTCGCGAREHLPPERWIAVGFGEASYSRDGETLWREECGESDQEIPTVADVEKLASADPEHDWRIRFYAPLYEAEYQRHGENEWALVSKGEGFA